MENKETVNERSLYVCVLRSFFANRFYNPGEMVSSKKNPGPNFRPFDPERDKMHTRIGTVPMDDFNV